MPDSGGHDTSTTTPGTPAPDDPDCREVAFSASQTTGPAPLSIQFAASSSTAGTGYFWSFGDGTYSYAQSPSHTYKDPGTYTVVLRVNEIECTRTNLVTVEEQCPVSMALGSSARARDNIAMLHSYRDRVLRTHPAGAVLVGFYYQHAREVSGILARDPLLKRRCAGLLDQLAHVATAALGGTQPAVTPAQLAAAQEILNLIAAQGSPSLQATTRFVLKWTSSQAFLQQLGIILPTQ
jgi:PKD repeat protein